jgi:hypothetical protein
VFAFAHGLYVLTRSALARNCRVLRPATRRKPADKFDICLSISLEALVTKITFETFRSHAMSPAVATSFLRTIWLDLRSNFPSHAMI